MAKINLLPWREERRKELLNEFLIMLGMVILAAALTVGLVHFYHTQLIDFQNERITYIEKRIIEVDKKIVEIKELEKQKEKLLARMRAIESLQRDRPLVVRLFDELVKSKPEGMTITRMTQLKSKITIVGQAASNARVSSFMRKIDESEWLTNPRLKIIEETVIGTNIQLTGSDKILNTFTLTFDQVVPTDEGADEVQGL